MKQILDIFSTHFAQYGVFFLGALLAAISFGIFYGKNTQHIRFYLISRGFFVLAFAAFGPLIAPFFPLLNPAFEVSSVLQSAFAFSFSCVAGAFFIASLFVKAPRSTLLLLVVPFFTIVLFALAYGIFFVNITQDTHFDISFLLTGLSLAVAAFGFYSISALSQKAIFFAPRIALWFLSIYYLCRATHLISDAQWVPLILYAVASIVVLIAQISFTEAMAISYHQALLKEQKKKTLFWDMAPSPILLTKLLDDSVVYMNTACQKVLGLRQTQVSNITFSNYFVNATKRDELIHLTRQNGIVDNFEVELNIQNTQNKTVWITLSSRVFEMDGDILLYINFTNITNQKEVEEKLFIQASTDTLTGLYNRRQFMALSQQVFFLAQREGTPYTVLMADIDHFKSINDTYGHDVGDVVLKGLASLMKQTLRKSDIIARWGGEEFIILLQNTPPEKGLLAADKLRLAVQDFAVPVQNEMLKFTISMGASVSQIPDVEKLQKEADLALYYSKENGRNQVTLFNSSFGQKKPE